MEIKKTAIVKKATHIIMESGLKSLTIHNLANELGVKKTQLNKQLAKDDDILLLLLLELETNVIELIMGLANKRVPPETELKLLFKGLYLLFLRKPFYLSLIFDKNLKDRDENIKNSFLRIRNVAENYLTAIIDAGKKENTFRNKQSTKLLVGKILSGFRFLMKDEQHINEMILELKTLKTLDD